MPITSKPSRRFVSLSARVLNCGPSMFTYVPPRCIVRPSAAPSSKMSRCNGAQIGSANATCATMPPPKNVWIWLVRSKNCDGSTMCSGAYFSCNEPTAVTQMIQRTPSERSAQIFARCGSSCGWMRWPRPWRGRK